ncbi:MAG: hypothetical protein FJX72_14720, partial [Armatimonadetes bacterium]|nr:hypothetical protein [Armatimonadota bacterium]
GNLAVGVPPSLAGGVLLLGHIRCGGLDTDGDGVTNCVEARQFAVGVHGDSSQGGQPPDDHWFEFPNRFDHEDRGADIGTLGSDESATEVLFPDASEHDGLLPHIGMFRADQPGLGVLRHPDAQRRFRVIASAAELQAALEYPWEKWMVFLHPTQRACVERAYSGPARVAGSAGTGKTIVAIHRAAFLARERPDARVLLTTFSEPLANALQVKLAKLLAGEPRTAERIEVCALDAVCDRLAGRVFGPLRVASREQIEAALEDAARESAGLRFSAGFLRSEWNEVVDAWQLTTWDAYRDVARLGRKTRLPESRRRELWDVFDQVRARLTAQGLVTRADLYTRLAAHYQEGAGPPYECAVVDEAQDIGVPQLRFLAALAGDRPDGLFFAGDLGQRIFGTSFSWKALGVDVRGRSSTLRVNYRTSHQIRAQADRLLEPSLRDVDGNEEDRRGTVSVFNGPPPEITVAETTFDEMRRVGDWLAGLVGQGVEPHEIGVFVRSQAEADRARAAVEAASLPFAFLDDGAETPRGHVAVGTMHLAKGLEFRAVAVMACDGDVLPLRSRIETATDASELEDIYNTERYLLYVACTRARDYLLVASSAEPSEFLDDMR